MLLLGTWEVSPRLYAIHGKDIDGNSVESFPDFQLTVHVASVLSCHQSDVPTRPACDSDTSTK